MDVKDQVTNHQPEESVEKPVNIKHIIKEIEKSRKRLKTLMPLEQVKMNEINLIENFSFDTRKNMQELKR